MSDDESRPHETEDRELGEPEYAVGYGRPPVRSQFKPGQSGNPKGRKKGQKSLRKIVEKAFYEKVSVRSTKGSRKIPKIEALVHKLINDALSGNPKAAVQAFRLATEAGLDVDLADAFDELNAQQLRDEDQTILDRYGFGNRDRDDPRITEAGSDD